MTLMAGAVGLCSVLLGLRASYVYDTPAGPSIICVAAALFMLSNLYSLVRRGG